jgi:hypothetical protein
MAEILVFAATPRVFAKSMMPVSEGRHGCVREKLNLSERNHACFRGYISIASSALPVLSSHGCIKPFAPRALFAPMKCLDLHLCNCMVLYESRVRMKLTGRPECIYASFMVDPQPQFHEPKLIP